jgi:regulatory protein
MVITSVEKHKNGKYMVYIDGLYSFSIDEETYLSMNFYEKTTITEEEISYIKNTLNYRTAKAKTINYLSLRIRSEKEVLSKLTEDGYSRETAEKVAEELKSMGYINDRLFAQKFVYDRSKLKPMSKKMMAIELQRKGVSSEIVSEIIADMDIDEYSVAEGLVKKKFGKYNLKDEKIIKRIYSFLHHRGYDFEFIQQLINNINRVG